MSKTLSSQEGLTWDPLTTFTRQRNPSFAGAPGIFWTLCYFLVYTNNTELGPSGIPLPCEVPDLGPLLGSSTTGARECLKLGQRVSLTCRSGLCGSISFTTWPCCTRMTWESPSQATCRLAPVMSAHTPVVPLCSRCRERGESWRVED